MSVKTKLMIEAGLALSGAVLGAAGAMLIEPAVIAAGVVAAGAGAYLRFTDKHVSDSDKVQPRKIEKASA